MKLEDDILDIQKEIKTGKIMNEASVSQGVILRLLNRLGWPVFDPSIVSPEFSVGAGRADYALCHPANKPIIIIESKGIGQSEGSERQLFEYAFHQGIPMAILTDGREWNFFLPGEQGSYHERCVYKLDLLARPVNESADIFERYLLYDVVCSGQTIENAKNDYKNVSKNRQIKEALPEAWKLLLDDGDKILVELIADKVETICGYKPSPEVVKKFIRSISEKGVVEIKVEQPIKSRKKILKRPVITPITAGNNLKKNFTGFVLNGKEYHERNAIKVLIKVFEVLYNRDDTFLESYAALPKHGRKRRYLSRNKMELYPDRKDLCELYSENHFGGWWVGTNYSRSTIWHAIELACEVAGLRFGHGLRLI